MLLVFDAHCVASLQKYKIRTHIGNNNNNKSRADAYAFLFKQIEEANTHRRTFTKKKLFHFEFRPTSKKKESEEIPQQISYDF